MSQASEQHSFTLGISFSVLNSVGLECLSSKQEVGSSNLSGPANYDAALADVVIAGA